MRVLEFQLNAYTNRSGEIKDTFLVLSGGGGEYGLNFYIVLGEKLTAVLYIYHRTDLLHRPVNLLFCGTSMLQRPKESVFDQVMIGGLQIDREMVMSSGEVLNKLKRRPMAAGTKGFDPYWRFMKGLYEQFITIMSEDYASIDLSVISAGEERSVSSMLDLGFLSPFLML